MMMSIQIIIYTQSSYSPDGFPNEYLQMVYVSMVCMVPLYIIYIYCLVTYVAYENIEKKESIYDRVTKFVGEEPGISTSFKFVGYCFTVKELAIADQNMEFSFDYWMDISAFEEYNKIDYLLNEYSIVIVDFEVKFADAETKQSYDRHVDALKISLATINGFDISNIVTNTSFTIGGKDLNREILYGKRFHSIMFLLDIFPLTRLVMRSLLAMMNLPRVKVKKIVSQSAIEISNF